MQQNTRYVQICPDCGEAFATKEEAREHWLQKHRVPAAQPAPSAGAGFQAEASKGTSSASSEVGQARLVEADEEGRPVIVRHVNEETGAARTVVMNEDGSMRMFGADTVSSMTTRGESDLKEWLAVMTDRHVRGLVNEVRERLVEKSELLFSQRAEVERLSKQINFQFFGLAENAEERQLDNAYRRLARSMHPDKNGGTQQAKEQFQAMKERYEELKTQIQAAEVQAAEVPPAQPQQPAAHSQDDKENRDANEEVAREEPIRKEKPEPEQKDEEEKGGEEKKMEEEEKPENNEEKDDADEESGREEGGDDAAEEKEEEKKAEEEKAEGPEEKHEEKKEKPRSKEAYDEDYEDCQPEASHPPPPRSGAAPSGAKSNQTNSRDKLEESVWKMLRQLKVYDQNLKIVERNLQRVQAEAGVAKAE